MALLHHELTDKLRLADRSYAEAFRLFGHELSKFEVNYLEIRNTGRAFHVLAKHTIKPSYRSQRERPNLKNRLSRLLFKRREKAKAGLRSGTFTRHYTPEEIQRRNSELKMKREWQRPLGKVRAASDGHVLSELLRTVGAILDADHAHFESLAKDNQNITIHFCDRNGKQVTKTHTLAAIQTKQRDLLFKRSNNVRDPWRNAK